MIDLKPQNRITSDGIIESVWIQNALQRHQLISRKLVEDAFLNMKSFKIGYQLQRAALIHMARTNIEKKEKDRLKQIFDAIDEDKDGEIELEEFVLQLGSKFDLDVKIEEMEKIMMQIDLDYDGKI